MIVPIPSLPLYGVRADGTVWSKKCKGPHRFREAAEWHQLRPSKNKRTGYWTVQLSLFHRGDTFLVHKLIALAFLGPRPLGDVEINHKDGNKDNNSKDNLEYMTYLANLQHAWDNNLIMIGKPKLTQKQVAEIRALRSEGLTQPAIAKLFNIGQSAVSDITNYRTWNREGKVA